MPDESLGLNNLTKPTSALDGLIETTDDHTGRHEYSNQQPQQQPTGTKRRPNRPIQTTMRGVNMGCGAESHDTQSRGHGPLPRCEDGTGEEDFHMVPYRFGKHRRKDGHDTDECGRQREHCHPFIAEEGWAFTAYRF